MFTYGSPAWALLDDLDGLAVEARRLDRRAAMILAASVYPIPPPARKLDVMSSLKR